jgi:phage baseplate assembly protein V
MLKYGTVSEVNDKGLVRVEWEEDEIVSNWMGFLQPKTKDDSYWCIPDIGEFVVCLVDENGDTGVVLGSIYTTKTAPQLKGLDITAVKFKDGTEIEYDRAAHTLRLKVVGDVTIECANATIIADGNVKVDAPTADFTGNVTIEGELLVYENIDSLGEIAAANDVTAGLGLISLLTHKHPTPVGPTSTPIP